MDREQESRIEGGQGTGERDRERTGNMRRNTNSVNTNRYLFKETVKKQIRWGNIEGCA